MVPARRNAGGAASATPLGGFALLEPADWSELAPLLAARPRAAAWPDPARPRRVGDAPSRQQGRGQDYAQSRAYQTGDDMRSMHWALLARTGKPYVRVHEQEQALAWHVLIDAHGSMLFGTRTRTKAAQAARAALVGAARQLARRPQARLDATLWTAQGLQARGFGAGPPALRRMAAWLAEQRIEPPAAGSPHARPVPGVDPSTSGFDAWCAALPRGQAAPTQLLLCSDFHGLDARAHAVLGAWAARAHVAAVEVFDPAESLLPELPPARFVDVAACATGWLAPGPAPREAFRRAAEARSWGLHQSLRARQLGTCRLCTTDSVARIRETFSDLAP